MGIETQEPGEQKRDLMLEQDVVSLMESSKDQEECDSNCDKVKEANGDDYPSFWNKAINDNGVYAMTQKNWNK